MISDYETNRIGKYQLFVEQGTGLLNQTYAASITKAGAPNHPNPCVVRWRAYFAVIEIN